MYGKDDEPVRRLTRDDLIESFRSWILENPQRAGAEPLEQLSMKWFDRLKIAALFIADDAGHFVFIHSTVLEFLAARFFASTDEVRLLEDMARPKRESLETLPILCSADWRKAHRILEIGRAHV